MCPFIDLINHSDDGCDIGETQAGFFVKADRAYDQGTEISICYGAHNNDFLLVEYGFTLASNRYDLLILDPFILPLLSDTQKDLLEENQFLGNYTLDDTGICHRTQVALRSMLLSPSAWHDFQLGETDGSAEADEVDEILSGVLKDVKLEAALATRRTKIVREKASPDEEQILDLIETRWNQVLKLVDDTLEHMEVY